MTLLTVAENFSRGYLSDIPRDQLPAGAAYRMKDYLPGVSGERLISRGAWLNVGPDLSTITGGISSIAAVAWAPFLGDEHLVAIADNGATFYDRNLDGVTAFAVSSGTAPANVTCPPFWAKDLNGTGSPPTGDSSGGLIIPATYALTASVQSYVMAGHILGSPPTYKVQPLTSAVTACVGCSWEDYCLLANGAISGTKYRNRIWVSAVGDPTTFTVGTDFWDSSLPIIMGLVPVRSGILVFGFSDTNIITGDTPPAGGNWDEQLVFGGVGCMDTRTIAKYGDDVIFANSTGVYITDGVTLTDLTLKCGVKQRWATLLVNANFKYLDGVSVNKAAGAVFENYYIIAVQNSAGSLVTCHVFDLARDVAFEFTNIPAQMFAHFVSGEGTSVGSMTSFEKLFFVSASSKHVLDLRTAFGGGGAVDANGTTISPQVETAFFKPGGPGKKVYRSARVTYDGGPVTAEYTLTPDGSYTTAGTLASLSGEDRERVDIRDRGRGIGLRLTGADTISEIELDLSALEGTR